MAVKKTNRNLKALKAYLKREGYKYFVFDGEDEIVRFGASTDSYFHAVHFNCCCDDNSVAYIAYADTRVEDTDIASLNEYVTRVNNDLTCGCLAIEMDTGRIFFKNYIDTNGSGISDEAIDYLISEAIFTFDVYGNGLLMVMLDLKEPEEAFNEAHNEFYGDDE